MAVRVYIVVMNKSTCDQCFNVFKNCFLFFVGQLWNCCPCLKIATPGKRGSADQGRRWDPSHRRWEVWRSPVWPNLRQVQVRSYDLYSSPSNKTEITGEYKRRWYHQYLCSKMFRELQVKQDKLMHQIKMLQKQVESTFRFKFKPLLQKTPYSLIRSRLALG